MLGTDADRRAGRCSSTALFLQALLDFLIIAFAIFMALKGINKLKTPPRRPRLPAPPADVVLLTEIRDLLKK